MKDHKILSMISLLLVCALVLAGCTTRSVAEKTPEPGGESAPAASADGGEQAPSSGAQGAEAAPSAEPTAEPTPEPTPEPAPEPTPEPVYYNPLTGEESKKDYGSARPVAVMIENNRWDDFTLITQGGISQAAIIYEMQVEKITRNMAIFMDIDQVGEILPVRSARSYFASAALAYDAIYVHRGQSGDGNEYANAFLQYYVDNDNIDLEEGTNAYRRQDWPYSGAVHSEATTGELLSNFFPTAGTRMEHSTPDFDYGLHFTENAAPTHGQPANNIRIVFPETKLSTFTYDAAKNGYTGVQWNRPYADNNTGEAAVFQNVLVLCTYTRVGIDAHGHSAMNTVNCEGTGYFCNGGYCEPITWSRGDYNTPFRYYTADGSELELGVGHTYIAFIDGEWSVSFP